MASLQIEVASSSSPFTYSLRDHNHSSNINGYLHSQCIRKNKGDGEDDSWLPTASQNSTVASESEASNHRKGKQEFDDSWLPTLNDTSRKCGKNTSEPENDIDYSWLPSSYIDNNKKKQSNDSINDKNKNKNKNKSKNKNNGSNSNGGTQKKSKNDHWALAREIVFSCDQQIQNTEVPRHQRQDDSPSKSRHVVESPTSGGVSNLLRRWRDFAEAKNSNKTDNNSPTSTRSNSGSTCKGYKNNNSPSRDGFAENNNPSQGPHAFEDEKGETPRTIKDSDNDWDSDKTSRSRRLSCPLPSRDSKGSNAVDAEKEKIRVVDIIKKLSREDELAASPVGGNGHDQSLPPIRTTLAHQQIEGDHKGRTGVRVSRHLIRGRVAFNNFLARMEHEKRRELKWLVERKAVSKFSHRGRLQALLRFRILRLGADPKPEDKRHKRHVSKSLESNRLDIMDLREKFNSGAAESRKHKSNVMKNSPNEETNSTKTKTKTTTNINTDSKKQERQPKLEPTTPKHSTQKVNFGHEITASPSSFKVVMHKDKDVDSFSDSITRKEDTHHTDDDKDIFYDDEGQFMSAKTSYSQMEERGISDSEWTNDTSKKQASECYDDWMISENSQTRSDLDEDESYDMQLFDTNYDWISDISRPKSDWEDMRQARYQEMLDPSSCHRDIRPLLERKNVSSFLASSLRDKIDQLMMSHIQQSHVQVEKQVEVREKGESRKEEVVGIEGKECEHEEDEDGECRSRSERQCSEYSEYVDQPYSERSWRPNDVISSSDPTSTYPTNSDPMTSPSLGRSLSSNRSHTNGTPRSSSVTIHPSIELELIYDLRGHMEQLHQEIMELRKSIKSCVNMQVKMQQSFKQHVDATAPTRSVLKKGSRKPLIAGKNDCCICGDMQIDSLLYRCGHMCACFKCAVELQRSSGECPVCEAPIMDVVKAFVRDN